MEQEHSSEYGERHSYYVGRILSIAQENEVDLAVLPERGINLAAGILCEVYDKYGNTDSDSYKPYHNDEHALNVIRRSWRLWRLFEEVAPERATPEGYELLLIAGAGHDLIHGTGGELGQDERLSGVATVERMTAVGYEDEDTSRVFDSIQATSVETKDGAIVQHNVQYGSRDLLKLALATADINGTTMEGIPTMVNDVLNLCMEIHKKSFKDILFSQSETLNFFFQQAGFIRDRLDALDADFAYYFDPLEAQIIKEKYENVFTSTTRDALGASLMLYRFPHLGELAITQALQKARLSTATAHEGFDHLREELTKLLTRRPR